MLKQRIVNLDSHLWWARSSFCCQSSVVGTCRCNLWIPS